MSAVYVTLPARGVISVAGSEAADFLQRIITNDVDRVKSHAAIYAALLSPQGKYLFDFVVAMDGEGFLLDCERDRLPDLLKRLKLYRLRAKIELTDVSDKFTVTAIYSGDRFPVGNGIFDDPRSDFLGQRAILPRHQTDALLTHLGAEAGDLEAYESLRISLAIPDSGHDLVVDKSTPLEVNFDELNAVDFNKGCYVGQEVTARMKHRANLRKRLLPVAITGEAPAIGTAIFAGDKEIGTFFSSVGQTGLALFRLDHLAKAAEKGQVPKAAMAELRPSSPEWADFDLPSFD